MQTVTATAAYRVRAWFVSLAFKASTKTQTAARIPRTPDVGWAKRMMSLMLEPPYDDHRYRIPKSKRIDRDQEKAFVLKEIVEAQRGHHFRLCARAKPFQFPYDAAGAGPGIHDRHDLYYGDAGPPVWDLPTTMTKLLHFGMPLAEVVRRATSVPAKIMGYGGTVGTLKPGANADVSVFELRDEDVELRDSDGNTVTARRRLLPQLTPRDGRVWYERPGE